MELGLIGWPVRHSFSPGYFGQKFTSASEPGNYRLFPLERIEDLPGLVKDNPGLSGFNVTIPHKEAVMGYLDCISDEAKAIGSVNTVRILRTNASGTESVRLYGFNTDCAGFTESLRPLLRDDIDRAIVLGYGGAARAVVYALQRLGIAVTVVSRKAKSVASGHRMTAIGYHDLDAETVLTHLLVVNTTPLGMWPDSGKAPEFPYGLLTSRHICYDLVYNPENTKFMRLCSEQGARVKNGLDMLYIQADAAWRIWHGLNIDEEL